MPIPRPKKNEGKDKFISRRMSAKPMQEYEQPQRYEVCLSSWNRRKKKEGKTNEIVAEKL